MRQTSFATKCNKLQLSSTQSNETIKKRCHVTTNQVTHNPGRLDRPAVRCPGVSEKAPAARKTCPRRAVRDRKFRHAVLIIGFKSTGCPRCAVRDHVTQTQKTFETLLGLRYGGPCRLRTCCLKSFKFGRIIVNPKISTRKLMSRPQHSRCVKLDMLQRTGRRPQKSRGLCVGDRNVSRKTKATTSEN